MAQGLPACAGRGLAAPIRQPGGEVRASFGASCFGCSPNTPSAAVSGEHAGGDFSPRLADRHGDKVRVVRGLYPHRNVVLTSALHIRRRLVRFVRRGNALGSDVESDLAGLHPVLGCRTVRTNIGDEQTLLPAPPTSFAGATDSPRWGRETAFLLLHLGLLVGMVAGATLSSFTELPGAVVEISNSRSPSCR